MIERPAWCTGDVMYDGIVATFKEMDIEDFLVGGLDPMPWLEWEDADRMWPEFLAFACNGRAENAHMDDVLAYVEAPEGD